MARVAAVIVAAGEGRRYGMPKIFVPLAGRALVEWAVRAFKAAGLDDVVVVVPPGSEAQAQRVLAAWAVHIAAGGATRSDSVRAGLMVLDPDVDKVLVHDAARPLVSVALIHRLMEAPGPAIIPVLPVADAVRKRDEGELRMVPRDELMLVQTPQAFARHVLVTAHAGSAEAADDAEIVRAAGWDLMTVEGERRNLKITWPEDLRLAEIWLRDEAQPRVGHGYDIHRLVKGTGVRLAGVTIPSDRALDGHSDADVVLHAIMDALLGAAGLDDIGVLFPPGQLETRGTDSGLLLQEVLNRLATRGMRPLSCDVTIVAEAPKIAPVRRLMRERLCELLGIADDRLGLKATTNEGVGPVGAGDAIAAWATVMVVGA